MLGRGISSKPSMLGKSGINNGTISYCIVTVTRGTVQLVQWFPTLWTILQI